MSAVERGTVVIVEDERSIAELVELYLRREGFRVLLADDGESGLATIRAQRPQLVVLDVGLPDLDGLEVCRRIRADPAPEVNRVPVMFLTARDDEVDRILGLEIGGDDYLTKPFSPREVVARVKAILRRVEAPPRPSVLRVGALVVDAGRREVTVGDQVVDLTTREFDLLAHLCAHEGLVLSRQQLLDGVWGVGWYGDPRTVDVHVGQLRKKLGDALPVVTVRGVGYRLDGPHRAGGAAASP
jgi:two-component system, OmpR family, response regulator